MMYLGNDVHICDDRAEEIDEKRKWYRMFNQIVNGEQGKSQREEKKLLSFRRQSRHELQTPRHQNFIQN